LEIKDTYEDTQEEQEIKGREGEREEDGKGEEERKEMKSPFFYKFKITRETEGKPKSHFQNPNPSSKVLIPPKTKISSKTQISFCFNL
jgi:hypothetical protein